MLKIFAPRRLSGPSADVFSLKPRQYLLFAKFGHNKSTATFDAMLLMGKISLQMVLLVYFKRKEPNLDPILLFYFNSKFIKYYLIISHRTSKKTNANVAPPQNDAK